MLPDQFDLLLEATDIFAPHLQLRNEVAVLLMYDLGVRVGELVGLDVEDVFLDDDEPYVYLRSEIQKAPPDGSEPDPAPLNLTRELGTARILRHYLNSRWKDSEALLPSQKSDRMGTEQVRNVVSKLAQSAEVEPRLAKGGTGSPADVTPHTLRHSVFYRMFVDGDAKLKEVSLRLRHGSVATTERIYAHVIRR
jgi:integrase/recombinase XerC/integrase/recombinase XerD